MGTGAEGTSGFGRRRLLDVLLSGGFVAFLGEVGTDIVAIVPLVGPAAARLLRGGDDVTDATLTRFFGFHVAILPAAFTALLLVHLLLVQRQGMSESIRKRDDASKAVPFYPGFIIRDAILRRR